MKIVAEIVPKRSIVIHEELQDSISLATAKYI
jgi:hypothetical protein